MRYVLDSSVALKWVLPEPDSAKALRLRAEFQAAVHELLAPDVFPVEVGDALTRAERRGLIPVGDADVRLTTSFTGGERGGGIRNS
jgi:predicted nucleic acid-binding protein